MPYRLRKSPKRDLYWVIGEDGTHHSKEPLPKERAEAQMKALYIAMRKKGELKGGMCLIRKKKTAVPVTTTPNPLITWQTVQRPIGPAPKRERFDSDPKDEDVDIEKGLAGRGKIKHPKRLRYDDSDSGSSSESDFDMDTAEKNAAHTLAEMKRTEVEPPPKRRYRGVEQQLSPDTLDMLDAMGISHAIRSPPLLNAFTHKVPDSPGATGRRPTQSREPPPPAGRRHRYEDAYEDSPTGSGYGGVSIPKNDFIKEHERLIQLLQTGTPAQRKREAKSQSKELAMKRGGGLFSSIYKLCNRGVIPDAYIPEPFVPLPMRTRSKEGDYNSLVAQVNKLVENDREYQRHENERRNPIHSAQNRGRGMCGGADTEPTNPTEDFVVEYTRADMIPEGDIKLEPEFKKLSNFEDYGHIKDSFLDTMISSAMKFIKSKTDPALPAEKTELYGQIGRIKVFKKQRKELEDKMLKARAAEKEAFDAKLKSKFVAPVYKTTEELGLGRGYGRMRGCGKEEDAARFISMFEEMKRKLEEARQPEPEPEVPDEDEEAPLQPRYSVHRSTSPGYGVIEAMMKPNESRELKKDTIKATDKAMADAKAFAEQLRSAGLEESADQKLPPRLMALDTKDLILRGLFMPQKGNEVTQEDIDRKIRLLRREVFEVGNPKQGLYEYTLEDLIPELRSERTIDKRTLKNMILDTAEELERVRLAEFPDYISSSKYKGFSGRGKSPYETKDVAKMMADARKKRKEMADERQRVRELEATMENWGAFMKRAIANDMTPLYLAELVVAKPQLFSEMTLNRAKYILRVTGNGLHGGSKEDWVVILNKRIADLKKETGSNMSKLDGDLRGLIDMMSMSEYDNMNKWLDEWQKKNENKNGYFNLDTLMSRLKDFWNSPLAGTFAIKPMSSPIKRMSEISEAIPENLKAWIEIKLKQKAEKDMRYMTPAEREADMARAMAFTDRAIVELKEAEEAAKLRRENPEEANRREAEAKAKASAEQAARLRQFQLDTKRRIAERHQRFRPAGYL